MKVEAIIIIYNHAKFVVEALDGIFQQRQSADEIVIADVWLRNHTTDEMFFAQFKANQLVRRDNVIHWKTLIGKIPRDDQLTLVGLLEKAAIFQWLQGVSNLPFFERLEFFFKNCSILSKRESFYTYFGKAGILGWRSSRRMLGRV